MKQPNAFLTKVIPSPQGSWREKSIKAFRNLQYNSEVDDAITKIREHVRGLTFAAIPLRSFKNKSIHLKQIFTLAHTLQTRSLRNLGNGPRSVQP